MKWNLLLAVFALATALVPGAAAAQQPYKVVFEVTGEDRPGWEALLRTLGNVQRVLPGASVEVIVHGKALPLLLAAENPLGEQLKALRKGGVRFHACENTMRRLKVERSALLPFVGTVDSAVAQLVRRQSEGWAYIKAGD